MLPTRRRYDLRLGAAPAAAAGGLRNATTATRSTARWDAFFIASAHSTKEIRGFESGRPPHVIRTVPSKRGTARRLGSQQRKRAGLRLRRAGITIPAWRSCHVCRPPSPLSSWNATSSWPCWRRPSRRRRADTAGSCSCRARRGSGRARSYAACAPEWVSLRASWSGYATGCGRRGRWGRSPISALPSAGGSVLRSPLATRRQRCSRRSLASCARREPRWSQSRTCISLTRRR